MYAIYSYINTLLNKLSDLVSRSFIRAKLGGGRDQTVLKEFFDLVKSMGLTPREHKMQSEWLDLAMPRQLAKTAAEQLKHIQDFVRKMHPKKGEDAPGPVPSGETEVSPRGVGLVVGQGNVVQKPEVTTTPLTLTGAVAGGKPATEKRADYTFTFGCHGIGGALLGFESTGRITPMYAFDKIDKNAQACLSRAHPETIQLGDARGGAVLNVPPQDGF